MSDTARPGIPAVGIPGCGRMAERRAVGRIWGGGGRSESEAMGTCNEEVRRPRPCGRDRGVSAARGGCGAAPGLLLGPPRFLLIPETRSESERGVRSAFRRQFPRRVGEGPVWTLERRAGEGQTAVPELLARPPLRI